MKATMKHPEANYLAEFKLPANDLEKVAGGTDAAEIREYVIRALIWATLTLYEFDSIPDEFNKYFEYMHIHHDVVCTIMYASFPKNQAMIAVAAVRAYNEDHPGYLKEAYRKLK